jgi:hypothetical protein
MTDKEIQTIINKKASLAWIKVKHPIHYKVLQLGAFCIKNNINDLEELKALITIKDRLLTK